MSLRFRLVFAFLAIVLVMVVVSVFSFRNSWRIRQRVADLTSTSIAEFEKNQSLGEALEIEGHWRADGAFVATEIEKLNHPRRPKLRGPIQAINVDEQTVLVYGMPILVGLDTEYIDGNKVRLDSLQVGDRLEISCGVDEDDRWRARKIRTTDLKSSDKVKGVVTAVAMDGISPDSLEISGITIILAENRPGNPQTELRRITIATRMSLAVQELLVAAHHVLSGETTTETLLDGDLVDSRTLLRESAEDLASFIDKARQTAESGKSRTADGPDQALDSRPIELALWILPLSSKPAVLDSHVARFIELADSSQSQASQYFFTRLEPFLNNEILPLIQAYLVDAEQKLVLEVKNISAQAEATARVLIGTSFLALVIALGLGFVVWRSISRPILDLKHAAEQIGRGRLDTRVAVRSSDELGVLAETINRMAGDLSATTVSMSNLSNIIDSMAGALIVLGPEGTILSVNKATLNLLGYQVAELVGRPFGSICTDHEARKDLMAFEKDFVISEEKSFKRKDGSRLSVSFAGSALRNNGGPPQGFVCVAQDLTERKGMEEKLRQSLGEKELLLREIHHRVKNNLQVISSLLDLQSSQIHDAEARDMYEDSQSRIRSMALIHEQLYRATDLDMIDFGAYLKLLTSSLFHSFGGQKASIQLQADVQPIRLGIDQALSCGLIINELVTNSLKHAFPGVDNGVVKIGFRRGDDGFFQLIVSDDGCGMPGDGDPEAEDTLGKNLVDALVDQLEGEMLVEHEGGTSYSIRFPEVTSTQEA